MHNSAEWIKLPLLSSEATKKKKVEEKRWENRGKGDEISSIRCFICMRTLPYRFLEREKRTNALFLSFSQMYSKIPYYLSSWGNGSKILREAEGEERKKYSFLLPSSSSSSWAWLWYLPPPFFHLWESMERKVDRDKQAGSNMKYRLFQNEPS